MSMLERLRQFQIQRLEQTYADLVEDPATRALGLFFIHDLYGRQDVQDRDAGVVKVYRAMEAKLSEQVVAGLKRLLRLHRITHEMDREVATTLEMALGDGPIDMETYEIAYRKAGTYELREEQIRLSVEAMEVVHRISRSRLIGTSLKAVRWVVDRLSVPETLETMLRGYDAFRNVKEIGQFVQTVRQREMERLDRIFQKEEPKAASPAEPRTKARLKERK
jgi:hypothetical protein